MLKLFSLVLVINFSLVAGKLNLKIEGKRINLIDFKYKSLGKNYGNCIGLSNLNINEQDLKNLVFIAKEKKLYKKFGVNNLIDLIKVLNLDPKKVRNALENNEQYFVEFLNFVKVINFKEHIRNLRFEKNRLVGYLLNTGIEKEYYALPLNSKVINQVNNQKRKNNRLYTFYWSGNSVGIYDFMSAKSKEVTKHYCSVVEVIVSQDQRYLASFSYDGTIRIAGDVSGLSDLEFFKFIESLDI